MTQWEYILQSYQNPHLVVGNLDTEVIARFTSKAEAEKILWSMDCLATMGLRILKIPAGTVWECTGGPLPLTVMGIYRTRIWRVACEVTRIWTSLQGLLAATS